MISFAKNKLGWFNKFVRNRNLNISDITVSKYLEKDISKNLPKSTDINVLLNRVKINQKNESRRKLYFSAAASAGLFLFGLVIF